MDYVVWWNVVAYAFPTSNNTENGGDDDEDDDERMSCKGHTDDSDGADFIRGADFTHLEKKNLN